MKQVIKDILDSFKFGKEGFSSRKESAFVLMMCICWIHYKFVTPLNATEFLIVDLCGVLILFGIVTIDQVIQLKNGNSSEKPNG